jgi:hypothetical protein
MKELTKPFSLEVEVDNCKYTVIQDADGKLAALRYGMPWRAITGDNLIYQLAA